MISFLNASFKVTQIKFYYSWYATQSCIPTNAKLIKNYYPKCVLVYIFQCFRQAVSTKIYYLIFK